METVKLIMQDVQKEIKLRHGWRSKITKGGYLVIDIPFELEDTFEVECMLQMCLEDLSYKLDVHFCYDFYEDKVKVYLLN